MEDKDDISVAGPGSFNPIDLSFKDPVLDTDTCRWWGYSLTDGFLNVRVHNENTDLEYIRKQQVNSDSPKIFIKGPFKANTKIEAVEAYQDLLLADTDFLIWQEQVNVRKMLVKGGQMTQEEANRYKGY